MVEKRNENKKVIINNENVVYLPERPISKQTKGSKQMEDMDRLQDIYQNIQRLHNDNARKVATLACRSAQTFVTKSVLD